MKPPPQSLLDVDGLTISYKVGKAWIPAVRDFCLQLQPGQIYGLVGESGSGKSTIAMALMRYLGGGGRIEAGGKLNFDGIDLIQADMRPLWAKRIKLVPQNAAAALNPSIKIGAQVTEVLTAAGDIDPAAAHDAMMQMFHDVSLADPEKTAERYPHELSGGMQQRVVIAMALIANPELLIMDEPTTGLDVTTEAVILDLIRELIARRNTGLIYITHNLGVVAQLCQRALVLYGGEIMEEADVLDLYQAPRHPYSAGLLGSIPKPGQSKRDARLQSIRGNPPALGQLPRGCVFAERCPFVIDHCRSSKPRLEKLEGNRLARCHRWPEIQSGELTFASDSETAVPHRLNDAAATLMNAVDLSKRFPTAAGISDLLKGIRPAPVRAVDGVNLRVRAGHTLGLVGESGSGKTTLARVIIGLQERSGGRLELLGMDIRSKARGRSRDVLSKIQMVFQNPQNSLNPYLSVRQAIRRPLIKLRGYSAPAADREVLRLLDNVHLRAEYADRFPDELSGGEKQRVAIARAFASDPELILCDEPVSALDVSVQAAVLNLLAQLQAERGSAYLFISHDLSLVGYLADTIAVMYLGQLFEVGAAQELFQPPFHPYTEALVSAIPIADPSHQAKRILLSDNLPGAQRLPGGCRFHTRCPRKIGEICEQEEPPWRDGGSGHLIRCHIPLDELNQLQRRPSSRGEKV